MKIRRVWIRRIWILGLSASFVLAAGCGANKSAAPASSRADLTEESGPSIVSEASSSTAPAAGESSAAASGAGKNVSERNGSGSSSAAPETSSEKPQENGGWTAYIDDQHDLHVKREDGTGDKIIVRDVDEAPCVAGEWVYFLPDLSEIDKVKLDGSQRTKVCDTGAMRNLNGNMAVTAEYKNGSILYKTQQLHEVGNSSSYPVSYYKLDLRENKLTPV